MEGDATSLGLTAKLRGATVRGSYDLKETTREDGSATTSCGVELATELPLVDEAFFPVET